MYKSINSTKVNVQKRADYFQIYTKAQTFFLYTKPELVGLSHFSLQIEVNMNIILYAA